MANIGSFTSVENGFTGRLITATINLPVDIRKLDGATEAGPHYRAYNGAAEIGAGWIKEAKASGNEYVSLRLDDPSFPQTIHANLYIQQDQSWNLVWERR